MSETGVITPFGYAGSAYSIYIMETLYTPTGHSISHIPILNNLTTYLILSYSSKPISLVFTLSAQQHTQNDFRREAPVLRLR